MSLVRKIISGILICIAPLSAQSQAESSYPQNYFRNPLHIPISLAGNFGECRPNHFHTGLDIKTQGRENLPVHAAADGYVYRVSVSHSGYGNCIYMRHPNGYVTVYAHLNDFYPELMQYVIIRQYEKESWNVDLSIPEGMFERKQGELIAYSGNTGGSTAPHLHFEIRDAKTEHVLNAGLFGLPVTDDLPPVPVSIALYNQKSIYRQKPQLFTLKKQGQFYTVTPDVLKWSSPLMRLAVLADDRMPGSANKLGVYAMNLYLDEALQAGWQLRDLDFSQNRYVNAFADYRLKEQTGHWYELLFRLPGNQLNAFTFLNNDQGALDLSDTAIHTVRIQLMDVLGNTTQIRFKIQYDGSTQAHPACDSAVDYGRTLKIENEYFSFTGSLNTMYDQVCLDYSLSHDQGKWSPVLQLLSSEVPVQTTCRLALKLSRPVPFELRSKLAFVHHIRPAALPGNNPQSGMSAVYENGFAVAYVRTLGNYYVTADTIPPLIQASIKNGSNLSAAKSIQFTVTEKITSVDEVRAELNGKWLRFVRRGDTYTYIFDEHCPKGKNVLTIKALDENLNQSEKVIEFTR